MASYVNSSTVGVDLNSTNTTAQFALGTRVTGSNNSSWVYVYMSGAASAGAACVLSVTGTAAMATIALAMAPGKNVAFAQTAFTAADYGWVCQAGLGMAILASATTAAVTTGLYVGTVAGHLSTTAGSATMIGVQYTGSSATATSWATTGVLSFPYIANANLSDS